MLWIQSFNGRLELTKAVVDANQATLSNIYIVVLYNYATIKKVSEIWLADQEHLGLISSNLVPLHLGILENFSGSPINKLIICYCKS